MFLISRHVCRALAVLRTKFHISLDVVRSAIWVESSPGYLIEFPPAVMRMQWGLASCRQKSIITCAYVTVCVLGMQGDLIMHHSKDGIGSFLPHFQIALHHAPKIFSKSCFPRSRFGGVMHQPFVTADCFSCGGVHHWHCHLIEVKACCCWFGSEFIQCKDVWGIGPNAFVEEVYCFLAHYVVIAYPLSIEMNWNFGIHAPFLCVAGAWVCGEHRGGTAVVGTGGGKVCGVVALYW